jgi:hypothetical protein
VCKREGGKTATRINKARQGSGEPQADRKKMQARIWPVRARSQSKLP